MRNVRIKSIFAFILVMGGLFVLGSMLQSCGGVTNSSPKSSSGVRKAVAQVTTDAQGHTTEQKNIMEKIKRDNAVGSIKHLYQISAYTGDVLEYHTVKGKITSGGKRLNPERVDGEQSTNGYDLGFAVPFGNTTYNTLEVLGDDGAYGSSMPYLYFFDTNDEYHQLFPTGGTYIHISERPLKINKAKFIFEQQ